MCAIEDVPAVRGGSIGSVAAKRQRLELKHNYNSQVGEVSWQKILTRGEPATRKDNN